MFGRMRSSTTPFQLEGAGVFLSLPQLDFGHLGRPCHIQQVLHFSRGVLERTAREPRAARLAPGKWSLHPPTRVGQALVADAARMRVSFL